VRVFPSRRPVFIRQGTVIRFGAVFNGFRTWLAINGGVCSREILGSHSVHLAANLFPLKIQKNIHLSLGSVKTDLLHLYYKAFDKLYSTGVTKSIDDVLSTHSQEIIFPSWFVPDTNLKSNSPITELDVLAGRHFNMLPKSAQESVFESVWTVSSKSNRQGLLLEGEALQTVGMKSIKSEPVRFGTVQLPPSGNPIILAVEHQTTGGYPRVLEVISADRAILAQLSPGTQIKFKRVTHQLALQKLQNFRRVFQEALKAVILKNGDYIPK
jgi:antagonist of KipI